MGSGLAAREQTLPHRWDLRLDEGVTERGVDRRDPAGGVFLGAPEAGEPSTLAWPVWYAGEVAPDYFGKAS